MPHTSTVPGLFGRIGGIATLPSEVCAVTVSPPADMPLAEVFGPSSIDASMVVLPREMAIAVYEAGVAAFGASHIQSDVEDLENDILVARWRYSAREDLVLFADAGGSDVAQCVSLDCISSELRGRVVFRIHLDASNPDDAEVMALMAPLQSSPSRSRGPSI